MIARPCRRGPQVVLLLECVREACEGSMRSAAKVRAELMKRATRSVAPDRQAVEVELEARTAKEVRVRGARDSFHLDVDVRNEQLRIDERAHAPGRGCILGQRATHVGRLGTRIDTHRRLAGATVDTQ